MSYGVSDALASGGVTINGGTLDLGASQNDTVGTLILDNAGAIIGSGTSTLTSTANFDVRNGSASAILGGSIGLTKTTTGTVTLSGVNTYNGATTISTGMLRLGATNAISSASAVTVASGAMLDLNSFSDTVGSIAGAGDVSLGSAILTAGGNNSSTTFSGVLGGPGGFSKAGTGTLTLSGVNTYTGATTITGGTLKVGAANVIADASAVNLGVAAGATFDLNNFSETIGSLAGAGSVTLGTGTLNAGADDSTTTFSGVVSGTGALIKAGTGAMTFTGGNTLSGAITLTGGTLALSGVAGTAASVSGFNVNTGTTLSLDNGSGDNANRIGDNTAIALNGGTFRFISDANGSTETIGALNPAGGASSVAVVHNGLATDSTSLTFSSLGAIAPGATVNFNATGGTLGAGSAGPHVFILGQANGFLGGWATVGSDFAEYFTDGVRAFSNYYAGSDGLNVNDPTKIILLLSSSPASAYTLTNAGTTTDLALSVTDLPSVDLGNTATRTLNLASGGLIKSTSTATTISGAGQLTAGGTSSGTLAVSVNGGDMLTISSNIINNAGLNGIYGDGDDGIVSLSKGDTGLLMLSGTNTYTGTNFLNAGIVQISAESNLGATGNDVAFGGGTLSVTTGFTANASKLFTISANLSGTIGVAAGQTLTLASASDVLTTSNNMSTLYKTDAGTLAIQSANPGFDGALQIDAGAVELRDAHALGDAINRGRIILNGGSLNLRGDVDTNFANDINVAANSSIDVNRLTGATPAVTHTVGNLSIGATTLTVTGGNGAALAIGSVTLSNNATFNTTTANASMGAVSGGFGFSKTGPGTLILNNAGTYAGGTVINGGTLQLAAANGISASSAVNIGSGATFDLNGFSDTIGSLAGTGAVQLSGTLTTGSDNSSTTFSGVIGGVVIL